MLESSYQIVKRASPTIAAPNLKKIRGDAEIIVLDPKKTREVDTTTLKSERHKLWLGFSAMEEIAKDAGKEPINYRYSMNELLKLGYMEKEAQELQETRISFPHVNQEMWPIARPDKVPGQQYHLTQVPFNMETDEETGFALVYNILFHFEKPATCYTGEDIIILTRERLDATKIEVGNIIQPIAPLCSTKGTRIWNGMIKAHLKNPTTDGVALLEDVKFLLSR